VSVERLLIVERPGSPPRIAEFDTGSPVYVRMGHPPRTGRSRNQDNGACESGVSVYPAFRCGDLILIDARMLDVESTCRIAFSHAPSFLAQGTVVGRGSDGEPVMRDPELQLIPNGGARFAVIVGSVPR
jgi:hypothetical protein